MNAEQFNAGKVLHHSPTEPVRYRLVCQCGAVELYPAGAMGNCATTQRCWACLGVAFGLRQRECVQREPA